MRRLKLSVPVALVATALFALTATAAFAEALGEFTVLTNAKSPKQAVTSTFESPNSLEGSITSSELESEQTATSKKLGTLHIMFFGVKCVNPFLGTVPGESLGDAKEIVLVLGEYHILGLVTGGVKLWLLINPVHIECLFSPVQLIVVGGNLIGTLTSGGGKTKAFKLTLKGSKGSQEIKEFTNDAGEKVKASLTSEKNENGKKEASSQNESKEVSVETTSETELT
jgi:hypothetical protein